MRCFPANPGAVAALLLITFCCCPANAQNEGRLLYPGLLGFSGAIENEAILAGSAVSGQIFVEERPYYIAGNELNFRIGEFQFKRTGLDDFYGGVPFFGIGLTNAANDYFSRRFSLDFAFGDEQGLSLFILPMKFSLLLHPPLDSAGPPYLKPYVGAGLSLEFISETDDFEGEDVDGWGVGFHFLAGIETVLDGITLGLEIGYSTIETDLHNWEDSVSFDTGGVWILFNMGFPF
jgi:hypothetical protein